MRTYGRKHACAQAQHTSLGTSVIYTCGQPMDNVELMRWTMEEEMRVLRAKEEEQLAARLRGEWDHEEQRTIEHSSVEHISDSSTSEHVDEEGDEEEEAALRHDEL